MEALLKKEHLNILFDLYESLLTEKQRLYFSLYFQEDYSLNEIAELYQISRNAIFDHLKKGEEHLMYYESKLNLLKYKEERKKLLELYYKTQDITFLEALGKLDE